MNHSMTRKRNARSVPVDAFVAQMQRSDRAALAHAIEQQNVAELERASIAARIKQARLEAGLSQPEMAEAIGVIPRTFQNYESLKDPRTPWGLMNQIAAVTGKTTEWLIHGDRTTPDLSELHVARDDQVDGGFQEFREHVAILNARLDHIESSIEQARLEREDQAAEIRRLLGEQSELLAVIRGLLGMDGELTLQDRLVQMLRDAQAKAGPGPARRSVPQDRS